MLVEAWLPCERGVSEPLKRRLTIPGRDIVVITSKNMFRGMQRRAQPNRDMLKVKLAVYPACVRVYCNMQIKARHRPLVESKSVPCVQSGAFENSASVTSYQSFCSQKKCFVK